MFLGAFGTKKWIDGDDENVKEVQHRQRRRQQGQQA